MPGKYTVEMLSLKYNAGSSDVRSALWANDLEIDANDMVEVDAVEKADAKVKKSLEDHAKAQMDAKMAVANIDETKAAAAAAHNKKIGASAPESEEGE